MVLTALAGALGFLTRLPVGRDAASWDAFRTAPWTFPVAGYVVGGLAALPLVAPLPAVTAAALYPVALALVAGVNHLDGVADLGDAAVVHDADARRDAMTDTDTGVGALVAVALVVAGVVLAAFALADAPPLVALGIVVAAEVAAKLGMAAIACFGEAGHEGLGSQLVGVAAPRSFVAPAVLAAPVTLLVRPSAVAAAALLAGLAGALAVLHWADARLGGASGDVFGAANEVGRLVALHVGVIAWTLS